MARNFCLDISRRPDSLHLFPRGEFDGSSASVLMNALESHRSGTGRIVVHTDGLTRLHPFGVAVLQNRLQRVRNGSTSVIFQGENRDRMDPR